MEQEQLNRALCVATSFGRAAAVKRLIKDGAEVKAKEGYPLKSASRLKTPGSSEVITLLLDNSHFEKEELSQALYLSTVANSGENCALLLERFPYLVNGPQSSNSFSRAIETGKNNIVRLFIDKGHDIKFHESFPRPPLEIAISSNNADACGVLLSSGADLSQNNWRLLKNACALSDIEVVSALLKSNIDINMEEGVLLKNAIQGRRYDTAKLLVDNGADVNLGTALQLTVTLDDIRYTKLLVENGANASFDNSILLVDAFSAGEFETFDYLVKNGADESVLMNKELDFVFSIPETPTDTGIKQRTSDENDPDCRQAIPFKV